MIGTISLIVNSLIIKLWKKLKSRIAKANPFLKNSKRMTWWLWISILEIGKIIAATKEPHRPKLYIRRHWWMRYLGDSKMLPANLNTSSHSRLTTHSRITFWALCMKKLENLIRRCNICSWVHICRLQIWKDG